MRVNGKKCTKIRVLKGLVLAIDCKYMIFDSEGVGGEYYGKPLLTVRLSIA